MNANDFLRISPLINDCPNCDSCNLGNGEGTLGVQDYIVIRNCKCGFNLEYDVRNGTSRAKVKKVIEEALSKKAR